MILLDANILMYAAGTPHPHKAPSAALLERIARGEIEAALDAEVLQEILHRYRAIRRWKDGRHVYDLARRSVVTVLPITAEVTDQARAIMDDHPRLRARDALHAAVCLAAGAEAICSYDADLEVVGILHRVEPPAVG
jgi:predicted nucleic acid-binding protein